jgi:phage terminase large subunit-like protein
MVYDDVVTESCVTNPDMIAKVTRSWEVSLNLTTQGGVSRYIGTRWHYADTYRDIIERGTAIARRHAITLDGTANGEPAFWPRDLVAKKRQDLGRAVFAAQMLLDPAAEGARDFEEEWLRYYEDTGGSYAGMNKYLLVDPASSKKKQSDYTAMAVIGLASDQNYYLLDAIRDRLNLTERAAALFALHRRWRPLFVGYESYGMQADIEYCYEKMRLDNYRFDIVVLGGKLAKVDRIRRMQPICEAGRFWLSDTLD